MKHSGQCAYIALATILFATQPVFAQTSETILQDGFEPTCYGTANDRPGCLVLPFNQPMLTATARVGAPTRPLYDVYMLVDRSGSTIIETAEHRNTFESIATQQTCTATSSGSCLDAWWGVGEIGYVGTSGVGYRHVTDMAAPSNTLTDGISPVEPGGCCDEATRPAISSALTGLGSTGLSCAGLISYSERVTCASSPAALAGFGTLGWPCFRGNAIPILVVNGDELQSTAFNCPTIPVITTQATARKAKIIGLFNGVLPNAAAQDMIDLATNTGAVDALNGNTPMVFSANNADADIGMTTAMTTLAFQPYPFSGVVIDDPSDSINIASLIDHVEVINDGSENCPNATSVSDTNADLFNDQFNAAQPNSKLCFRIVGKPNVTIPATSQQQLLKGWIGAAHGSQARMAFWVVIPAAP